MPVFVFVTVLVGVAVTSAVDREVVEGLPLLVIDPVFVTLLDFE